MFMSTHYNISKSIIDNIDETKSSIINNKNFIYGNLKPDAVSTYFLKKHYLTESFEMIKDKIEHLCSFTLDKISGYISSGKLSQELGVICHFLCDFFCVAHSQRWNLNHSLDTMTKHIAYEKDLDRAAKSSNLSKHKGESFEINKFGDFFNNLYNEYVTSLSCQNDLLFSSVACNSVVNHILDCILKNSHNSNKIIIYA